MRDPAPAIGAPRKLQPLPHFLASKHIINAKFDRYLTTGFRRYRARNQRLRIDRRPIGELHRGRKTGYF